MSDSPTFSDKVQASAGLVIAVFAGVLNFVGLSSSEVPTVLRNQGDTPTYLMLLLALAVLAALGGAIIIKPPDVPWALATAVVLLVVSAAVWSLHLVVVPGSTTTQFTKYTGALTYLILVPALFSVVAGLLGRKIIAQLPSQLGQWHPKKHIDVRQLLVLMATALTLTSAYMAVRLETRSQLTATRVELTASVTETSSIASASITIAASRLRSKDQVGLQVLAVPRAADIVSYCTAIASSTKTGPPCLADPCYYLAFVPDPVPGGTTGAKDAKVANTVEPCVPIGGAILAPDATGAVQQTVVIPFSDVTYQHLQAVGEICGIVPIAETVTSPPPNSKPAPQPTGCVYNVQGSTRTDLSVPLYSGS